MGLLRLVFLLALILAVAWLGRDLLKRLGTLIDSGPTPPDGLRPGPAGRLSQLGQLGRQAVQSAQRPQLVAIERSAWDVLGLEPDASRIEIEAAYRKILHDNDPQRVAGLSPQLQGLAARLCQDAEKAYQELVDI